MKNIIGREKETEELWQAVQQQHPSVCGHSKRDVYYKLIDPFCIFYLRYVPDNASYVSSFWQQNQTAQSIVCCQVVWEVVAAVSEACYSSGT